DRDRETYRIYMISDKGYKVCFVPLEREKERQKRYNDVSSSLNLPKKKRSYVCLFVSSPLIPAPIQYPSVYIFNFKVSHSAYILYIYICFKFCLWSFFLPPFPIC